MKRRSRILLVALLVVIPVGLAWVLIPSGPREPVYEGRPVNYWLRNPKIPGTNATANSALPYWPKMDSKAVPFLARALETREGRWDRFYLQVWYRTPGWIGNHLPPPVRAAVVRVGAANVLGTLGNDAKPAIPVLIRTLQEDENGGVRCGAVFALLKIGAGDEQVTEAVVAALKDKDPNVRFVTGQILKQIDPEAAAKAGVK
jgi:hypothetical protein